MKRVLVAIALVAVAGAAAADALRVGYATYPFELKYVINDLAPKTEDTQGSASFSAGQFQLLYELDRKAADNVYLVMAAGVGIPAGVQTFDRTKEVTGGDSTSSKNDLNTGDTVELQVTTVPVLVGAKYVVPLGTNQFTAGILAGSIISSMRVKVTETGWSGTVPSEIRDGENVIYAQVAQAHVAVLVDLGFNMGMGDMGYIGLAVPVGMLNEIKTGNVGYTETPNPKKDGDILTKGVVAGGLTFGVNICWVKPF